MLMEREAVMGRLLTHARPMLPEFSSQELSNTIYGCAK